MTWQLGPKTRSVLLAVTWSSSSGSIVSKHMVDRLVLYRAANLALEVVNPTPTHVHADRRDNSTAPRSCFFRIAAGCKPGKSNGIVTCHRVACSAALRKSHSTIASIDVLTKQPAKIDFALPSSDNWLKNSGVA